MPDGWGKGKGRGGKVAFGARPSFNSPMSGVLHIPGQA
jgi:hypothetical protein